jgi:hypothetical protein
MEVQDALRSFVVREAGRRAAAAAAVSRLQVRSPTFCSMR